MQPVSRLPPIAASLVVAGCALSAVAGLSLAAHFVGIGRDGRLNDLTILVYLWSSAVATLLAVASLFFHPVPKIGFVAVALMVGNFVVSFLVAAVA